MAIRTLENFPSNGTLKSERDEYLRLFELGATRTTTGNVSFSSTSSGKVYNTLGTAYANQGQNGMMNLLFYGDVSTPDNPKLVDYAVIAEDISKIKAGVDVVTAGGTGTAITLTMSGVTAYEANSKYTFIASANNSGAATTININGLGAKNLYKPNTTTSPNVVSGKAYTVWYNGTDFFLQASAEGNAVAGDVLAGKTFSNDDDTGIAGTMPNRAGDTAALSSTVSGTTLKLVAPNGYYDGNDDAVTITDADFVAENIKNGVNIFGLLGTNTNKLWASGSVNNVATTITFMLASGSGASYYYIEVIGLSFVPSYILVMSASMSGNFLCCYDVREINTRKIKVIYTENATIFFQANGNANIGNSFKLPVNNSGTYSYQWIAIE